MKKLLCIVFALALLGQMGVCALAVPVAEVSSVSGALGQTVTVRLSVTELEGVRSIMAVPMYDAKTVELVGTRWLVSGDLSDDWSAETGDAVIAFRQATGLSGDVLELTFRLLAETDSTSVSCELTVHTDDKPLEVTVSGGSIQVTPLRGDVNGDGKINMKDWLRLYDHLSEVNPLSEENYFRGDVNNDGKVNMKDWLRLYDHLSEINPL